MRETLPKKNLLIKPWQYRHVYSNGKRVYGKNVAFIFYKNNLQHDRLGISISGKKLATRRNRIKRLIKEFYRLNKTFPSQVAQNSGPGSFDMVVSTTKKFEPRGLMDIERSFNAVLQNAPKLNKVDTQ